MDNKQVGQPTFSRVMIKGIPYYRTRIKDADGKRVSLYARTEKELVVKLAMARGVIEDAKFRGIVQPGDTLQMPIDIIRLGKISKIYAEAYVNGKLCTYKPYDYVHLIFVQDYIYFHQLI